MWILLFCLNPTWAGCAWAHQSEFPSEESCYRALREIKSSPGTEGKSYVAYCRPKDDKGGAK
jgi:hypothetical protein